VNLPTRQDSAPATISSRDPAGAVHLFWTERVAGSPNAQPDTPDTLMYARWEDGRWSQPLDIFFSPREVYNKRVNSPRAVMDKAGTIHLIWIGPDYRLFYSSAPASSANSAQAWRPQELIAYDQAGTQFSADIAYGPPDTLHILYGAGTGGGLPADNRTNRAVVYIRSEDGGATWSDPVDVFTILDPTHGPSNIRLYADPLGPLYATWTEWDSSGNGQAIYFARSPDGGHTWQPAVVLDRRIGEEYERDWTALEKLDDGSLVALWEGGSRAYPQSQYSYDGGENWSRPIDTFYWLIADNGFAEFERDSAGRLHVFLSRRIREGLEDRCDSFPRCGDWESTNTLWHSVWEGGTNWREPRPAGDFIAPGIGGNYPSVATSLGNKLFAVWFGYTEGEIELMQCEIEDAPALASVPWPVQTPSPTQVAVATHPAPSPTSTRAVPPAPLSSPEPAAPQGLPPEMIVALGLGPAIVLVVAAVFGERLLRRNRVQR
jgi:hypothetical protein